MKEDAGKFSVATMLAVAAGDLVFVQTPEGARIHLLDVEQAQRFGFNYFVCGQGSWHPRNAAQSKKPLCEKCARWARK